MCRSLGSAVRAGLAGRRRPRCGRPPGVGDRVEGCAGAVLFGDLGGQSGFVVCQGVGGVNATEDDEFGSERAEPFDLTHAPDRVDGVEGPQLGAVEDAVEGGVGDGMQVFHLACRQVEVEGAQPVRRGEGAVLSVATGDVGAEPGGLGDAQALGQHGPGGCLVWRVEPARPQPG